MTQHFTYVPVMDGEGRRAFEVITSDGRGTGIIRGSAQSANGCAQTLNYNAQRLIKQRVRAEARQP
jgi:hypothetical protein